MSGSTTPSIASEWTCPEENLIQWKDTANPEPIPAFGVKAFLARYQPGTLGGGGDDPAFLVSASVFSSFGQFTKTGYSTGMKDGGDVIANVYLTDTTVEADALTNSPTNHMFGTRSFTSGAQDVDIYVALADVGREGDDRIPTGTKLIVNVPPGFVVDEDLNHWSYSGFDDPNDINDPSIEVFADDSTQIVATLQNNLGTADSEAVKILRFRVDVPTVTSTKVYIMHTLVRGETDPNQFGIGALGEFPLHVVAS